MAGHDIITIGASAGGVEAISTIARDLPADLPAAVFVVIHVSPGTRSVLPKILTNAGPLPATHGQDGMRILPGRIYVAPPDNHLLVTDGRVRVVHGPHENRFRPAIDPLFRSAAQAYGPRVIGAVLTGGLNDGTAGLAAIKKCGGVAVVQDPEDAVHPDMPRSASRHVAVDHLLPLSQIAAALNRLAHEPPGPAPEVPPEIFLETQMMESPPGATGGIDIEEQLGTRSVYSCPECGGALWEVNDTDVERFRCHTGHAYTVETLLSDQDESLQRALWVSLRALQERSELSRRMAESAKRRGFHALVGNAERKAVEADTQAAIIRQILHRDNGVADE